MKNAARGLGVADRRLGQDTGSGNSCTAGLRIRPPCETTEDHKRGKHSVLAPFVSLD